MGCITYIYILKATGKSILKQIEMKQISKIIIAILILLGANETYAQKEQFGFKPHWRFGGGVGLSFGDGFFSGSLAPSAIYQFNEKFAMGAGLSGTYNSLKNRYNSTILGGSAIALYNVVQEIQVSAEFEELNVTRKYEYDGANFRENYWYPGLFLGVGFHSRNVTVGIRYDVLYNKNKSVYADAYAPFVRVYF